MKAVIKAKIDLYVSSRVKERREHLGLSQKDIAEELEISKGFIGKIESHKYTAHYNVSHLNRLAKILHCSPQEFLPAKPI